MEPKPTRSEYQEQARHIRRLQGWAFVTVNLHLVLAMASVGLSVWFLPKEKYDMIREVLGLVIGYILASWKTHTEYTVSSSAGSQRSNEALRQVVQSRGEQGE